MRARWHGLLVLPFLLAAGCGAPVYHVVRPGETLYSISFRYGKDYRQMAQWNNLAEPYQVGAGQYLRIIRRAGTPSRRARRCPLRRPRRRPRAAAAQAATTAPEPASGAVEVYGLNETPATAPGALTTPVETAPGPGRGRRCGRRQWPTARASPPAPR